MNLQPITAEHHLLKALQMEEMGRLNDAVTSYRRAYKLKPELDGGVSSFFVDDIEYDLHGHPVGSVYIEEDRSFKDEFTPVPLVPQKFAADDPEAAKYLEENGYVVFSQLANEEQVEEAKKLFWDHMEFFTLATRYDPATWSDENWPGDPTNGILSDIGIGQSEFLWYVRTLPSVRKAFGNVWGDDDLLVSFDGCGVFRPLEYNRKWRTKGGWFHIDQNLYKRKGRHCVQGLINLLPSGEHDGGFLVVPQSHRMMEKVFEKYDDLIRKDFADYFRFARGADFWAEEANFVSSLYSHSHALQPVKLCLDPGDFVMWDSRTVHCNTPPTKLGDDPNAANSLKRLVGYICMAPTKSVKDLDALVENRIFAFQNGISTTHWPHEYYPASSQKYDGLGAQSQRIRKLPDIEHLVISKARSEKQKLFQD